MDVERTPFGVLPDGRHVDRIRLGAGPIEVGILTYGGILASVLVPDRRGDVADVVLGFEDLDGWLSDPQYFGALVGRFANRIRNARFPLDGSEVAVTPNRRPHHLHGGSVGFDKVAWRAETFDRGDAVGVVLSHRSPAGDEGFPGTLDVRVTYSLDRSGSLTLEYEATTDAPTVVNLTNHVYFDLSASGSILDHSVSLNASHVLEVDADTMPTGVIRPVARTPFDFRQPRRVGDRIDAGDEQLRLAGGYDHCWAVDGQPGAMRPCAIVEAAGRRLEVDTTQPGVQFYSGNGIRPRTGRGGRSLGPRSGLCLETQGFPDSPNQSGFPSTRLGVGDEYRHTTVFRFGP